MNTDSFFEHESLSQCFWHTDRKRMNTDFFLWTRISRMSRMFLAHGWIYHAEDYILTSEFRRIVIRMERLLPFGQWVYDKSRDSCDSSDSCSKKNPSAFYPCAKWYPFKFCGWIIQWSGGKICVHLCHLWETKIIIRGGRNDLSVGKNITNPLYLPLKRGGLVCPYLESPLECLVDV